MGKDAPTQGKDEREKNMVKEVNIMDQGASAEMPKYKCYKEVHAFKIAKIVRDNEGLTNVETDGSAMITPEDKGYAAFKVDSAYMSKHKPEVGGYYVVYKDGYKSFSPAKAFEEGYQLIK